jgi:HEAT repeat protein
MWDRLRTSIALCFLAFTLAFARGAEPTYEHKPLSTWLKAFEDAQSDSSDERRAKDAVRAIGTNAVPHLLQMLTGDDINLQQRAANAFEILGPIASPAVPQLSNLLVSTNAVIGTLAGTSLGNIGAPALPALMAALTNRHYGVVTRAALAIVNLGTNASPAIPIFLRDLQSPNHFVRERAADALGNLHIEPAVVIPALTNLFTDLSQSAVCISLTSLGQFESAARPATPAILVMLQDPNENVRMAATNAIMKIAPDQLTNAPSK